MSMFIRTRMVVKQENIKIRGLEVKFPDPNSAVI